ncbi:MAG TPA: YchE family NAAT transporter [Gammaproteobacteria bacterium]|nr:YchE family NAAT transporter [Gammaproteobacteria bacterium]
MHQWAEYAKFFAALLAMSNPIGAIPIFIDLTSTETESQRRKTAFNAALTAEVVLVVTLLAGEVILNFFGISIASFRVAGGILLLLMALSMLQARVGAVKQTAGERQRGVEQDSVAVVPLGLPLLAGPGAISTVILYSQHGAPWWHGIGLAITITVIALLIWLSFRAAPLLVRALGKTGINVVTRIMGLITAAIGVEFIAAGLRALFPVLS